MQVAQRQPSEVIRHKRLIDSVHTVSTEVLERGEVREYRDDAQRTGADESGSLVLHLHASQSKNNERQQRQKHDKYRVTIHNYQFSIINFQFPTIVSYSEYYPHCRC